MVDQHQHQREFEEQGYTTYTAFFSQSELDELEGHIHSAARLTPGADVDTEQMFFLHNLASRSEALRKFVSQQKIVDLLSGLAAPDVWMRWDQAVEKRPGADDFPWHQDNGYNHLKDEHFQFWIALTDVEPERGQLWLLPGGHKHGTLPHKRVGNHLVCEADPERSLAIEAKRGDVIVFSSLMPHMTTPNSGAESRWVFVLEYMRLDCFDPFHGPPYLIISRNGCSIGEYERVFSGRLRPANLVKYFYPRLRRTVHRVKRAFTG